MSDNIVIDDIINNMTVDDVLEEREIIENPVMELEIDNEFEVLDKREQLQDSYNEYSDSYIELTELLGTIIKTGEYTEENKQQVLEINDVYDEKYETVVKQLDKARKTIEDNKSLDFNGSVLMNTQDDVFNALTKNGEVQAIYRDSEGRIYINAQYLQTRGLRVVNDDGETTLYINEQGNLTTSGDIVGGTITGTKLKAMTIDTNEVNIESKDGSMVLQGATQQFKDKNNNIRIHIGKDTNGDFVFKLMGANGETVLIDQNGIKQDAIQANTITADHIKTEVFDGINANIINLTSDKATIGQLNATNATIGNLKTNIAEVENLVATKANISELSAANAKIDNLESNKANIRDLNATNANITNLKSDVASINTLLAGNITSENIQTGAITAGSGIIADGAIGSAQISSIDAGKISAGKIDTSKVEVAGANNHLKIKGNRLQVFQGTGSSAKERVSLGDVNGNGSVYGLRVRGADGTTILLDENGVKSEGITDGAITNDKISDDANIDGAKLNINSVVSKLNEDGTETINGTKIEVDGTNLNTKLSSITNKQTADGEKITQAQSQITANANAIKLKVDNQTYQTDKSDMTSKLNKNTSEISAMKGQIALKVEQTDIDNAKSELEGSIDSKINTAKGEIKVTTDTISQNVSNLSQTVSNKADGSTVTAINNKVGLLETSVNGISGKVTNLEKTTTNLGNSVSGVQGEVETLKSDVASLEVTTTGISQKVSSVESTTSSLSTQVTTAQNTANQAKTDASNANKNATNAMNKANSANSLADSKAKVFTTTPTVPYKIGDLWVQGTSGDVMRCKTARTSGSYTASDWEKASKYTDDTKANAVDGKVTTLQGTVDNTNSKVATLETNLSSITSRVSTVENKTTTIEGKVNSHESRLTTAESKITDKAIINTVSSTIDQKVNTGIQGIQIGGRNLAQKTSSEFSAEYTNFSGITNVCPSLGKVLTDGLKVGDRVTVRLIYEYSNIVVETGQIAKCWIQGSGNVTAWNNGSFGGSSKLNLNGSGTHEFLYDFTINSNHLQNEYWSVAIRHDYVKSGSVKWKMFKVEKGTRATDWTPAPEDIDNQIADAQTILNGNIDNAISSAKDDILDNVSQNYATSDKIIELQETVSSNMQQTNKDINMRFETAQNYTKEVDGKLQAYQNTVATNIRFSENGIELGKTSSPFTAALDNTKLAFKQNGEEVAYISNNKMHITQAEIKDNLRVGDSNTGFFTWTKGTNGNLSLKWSES